MHNYLKIVILLVIGLHCSVTISAQPGTQYWNTESGLSNNTVSQVLQDQEGYIWLATQYGLNRFDGYKFKQFRYQPNESTTLSANWVSSIAQDSLGLIWLAADYGGVHAFDPKTEKAQRFPLLGRNEKEDINVEVVHVAKNQSVWVSTRDCVFRKRKKEDQFHELSIRSKNNEVLTKRAVIKNIEEDQDGNIYLLTNFAVYRFDAISETFQAIFSFPKLNLKRIYIDRSGQLWGITKTQLLLFHPTDSLWKSEVFYEDDFRIDEFFFEAPIYEDLEDHLWIATRYGVLVINKKSKTTKRIPHAQLFPNRTEKANVLAFFEDRHRNMWMGTSNGLLLQSQYGQRFQAQQQIPHLDSFEEVRAMVQVGDSLFIANSRGIFLIDLSEKNRPPTKLSNAIVLDFLKSSNGYLYAVGYAVYQIQLPTMKMATFDLEARAWSLAEDRKGNIWVSSGISGLQRFNPSTKTFNTYSAENIPTLKDNPSLSLLLDSKDRLWLASLTSGVYLLENASKLEAEEVPRFLNFDYDNNDRNSLSNSAAITLIEDLEGNIWVGTDGGLNRIDGKDYAIKRYMQNNGLKDEKIMSLQLDEEGNIWGSTIGHGIFKFNPATEQFTFFSQRDGLVNDNFLIAASHQNESGWLFFGSHNQLQVIDPVEIYTVTKPQIPLTFTECTIAKNDFTTKLRGKSTIELPHNYQSLNVHYTTLNFYHADKTDYWYQVEGLHSDWQSNGKDRSLTFTALSPDSYILKVKAVNPDLAFEQEMIELKIIIHPPWWKTRWAYLSYLLLGFGGIYAIYRFQLQQKLKQAETERLQELDSLKTRFFTNITHELRTPLTIILGVAEQLQQFSKKDLQEKAKLIDRNGKQLLDLINQVLDLSKLEAGKLPLQMQYADLLPYLSYLLESFHSMAEAKNIRLHFLPQIPTLWMDYDSEKIKHIISNLLSNALKYTPEGGDVYLQIRTGDKVAILTFKDNGKGISESDLPHIFDRFYQVDDRNEGTGVGLSLVKELVQLLDGTIQVESQIGKGTAFEIRLPITDHATQVKTTFSESVIQKPTKSFAKPAAKGLEGADIPLVLIVEDNVDVQNFLIDSLKQDYRIETANDGQKGIEQALESIPDLIVSDVMMPEKDGFELCQTLKTDRRTSHIPIILLTAKADLDSRLEGLEQGADAYIYKPFEQKELHIRIRKLLELRQHLQQRFQSPDFWQQQGGSKEEAFLQQVKQIIESKLNDTNFGIPQLCQKLGISRPHLHRKLKALTNQSTSIFIRRIRLQKARHLLQTTDLNVSEVAYEVGFSDPAYFSRVYVELFGEKPSATHK